MKITETCGCGATFTAENPRYETPVRNAADAWRRNHKHQMKPPETPPVTWSVLHLPRPRAYAPRLAGHRRRARKDTAR